MRKLYQKNWMGIDFASFSHLSKTQIADEAFYEKFYQAFYKNYTSYEALPSSYVKKKKAIAQHLGSIIEKGMQVLSIGAGNGLIEKELSKDDSFELMAMEPSKTAGRWLLENENVQSICGYYPQAYPPGFTAHLIYSVAIDYVFTDEQYLSFLKTVKASACKTYIMHGATIYEDSAFESLKNTIRSALIQIGIIDPGQFWGYVRTLQEQKELFVEAGFRNIQSGQLDEGPYWIMGSGH